MSEASTDRVADRPAEVTDPLLWDLAAAVADAHQADAERACVEPELRRRRLALRRLARRQEGCAPRSDRPPWHRRREQPPAASAPYAAGCSTPDGTAR